MKRKSSIMRKPCPKNKVRNHVTKRCRSNHFASNIKKYIVSLNKPCKHSNQERHSSTRRCRKIKTKRTRKNSAKKSSLAGFLQWLKKEIKNDYNIDDEGDMLESFQDKIQDKMEKLQLNREEKDKVYIVARDTLGEEGIDDEEFLDLFM